MPGAVRGWFGKFDYRPAFRLQIDEKIAKAAEYHHRHLIAETWLVLSADVNKWGAAASTMIAADVLRVDDLNALCHVQLDASEFECACLVLPLGHRSASAVGTGLHALNCHPGCAKDRLSTVEDGGEAIALTSCAARPKPLRCLRAAPAPRAMMGRLALRS